MKVDDSFPDLTQPGDQQLSSTLSSYPSASLSSERLRTVAVGSSLFAGQELPPWSPLRPQVTVTDTSRHPFRFPNRASSLDATSESGTMASSPTLPHSQPFRRPMGLPPHPRALPIPETVRQSAIASNFDTTRYASRSF